MSPLELGRKLLLRISVPLLAVAFSGIPNSLQASTLLFEQTLLDFEQMLAAEEFAPDNSTSSSSTSFTRSPRSDRETGALPTDPNRPSQQFFIPLQTFFGGSSPGSSSSSPSSMGGNIGTDTFPSDSAAPVSLFDIERVAWVCGELRFSLPTPPGNEIFRPPQAG